MNCRNYIKVADVAEAMMSHRPYRPGLSVDKALEEIRCYRIAKYHPEMVDACYKLLKKTYTCLMMP
jgi:putative two-component system response regulator